MVSRKISGRSRGNIGEMIPHIVQTACAYQSAIVFQVDNKRVNAKSIMGVMALASQNNADIEISADGPDEAEALGAVSGLME